MSKTIKRKISVELQKPRDLSKNRLSVFQRLGSKKPKSIGIVSIDKSNKTQNTKRKEKKTYTLCLPDLTLNKLHTNANNMLIVPKRLTSLILNNDYLLKTVRR